MWKLNVEERLWSWYLEKSMVMWFFFIIFGLWVMFFGDGNKC